MQEDVGGRILYSTSLSYSASPGVQYQEARLFLVAPPLYVMCIRRVLA